MENLNLEIGKIVENSKINGGSVGNDNIIKPEWFKREKLNLWLRIKLFFKPTKISWDVSSTESTTIWLKVCDGKIFILSDDEEVEQINNLTKK